MFNVQPNREPQPERQPRGPAQSNMPLAQHPAPAKSWWGTVPGQLALVAMLVGAIVILLGATGIIGPLSLR